MERKYLSKLEEWIKKPNRKPLMVWGARQVGKSYLIEELFAKKTAFAISLQPLCPLPSRKNRSPQKRDGRWWAIACV